MSCVDVNAASWFSHPWTRILEESLSCLQMTATCMWAICSSNSPELTSNPFYWTWAGPGPRHENPIHVSPQTMLDDSTFGALEVVERLETVLVDLSQHKINKLHYEISVYLGGKRVDFRALPFRPNRNACCCTPPKAYKQSFNLIYVQID